MDDFDTWYYHIWPNVWSLWYPSFAHLPWPYNSCQWISVMAIPMMSLAFLTPLDIQISPQMLVCISHRIHGTGLFTYLWLIFMVNVSKCIIHGSHVFGGVQIHPRTLKNDGGNIPSKIERDLTNGPLSVSCDRAIRYSGFFGGSVQWVMLADFLENKNSPSKNKS